MRTSIFKSLFVMCILCFAKSYSSNFTEDKLFLTPYIESGKIEEARNKAIVQHVDMKSVNSYAGYITINATYNSNTFFWYFPTQHNSTNEPLILWMNGGPGSTSLIGLFVENGPFVITSNKTLEIRKHSWIENHNVIYIDNPIGSGYSFTENDLGYANSVDKIARDVLNFLLQFFKLFPELKNNDFYVTGESYAGKYVPAVSYAIKMHNEKHPDKINLKGLAIGNGLTDPVNQMVYSDLLFNLGLLDSVDREEWKVVENDIRNSIRANDYKKALASFFDLLPLFNHPELALLRNLTNFETPYNILKNKHFEREIFNFIDWVQQPSVEKAIHVSGTKFSVVNQIVSKYLEEDFLRSVAGYVENLLENYKVLLYNGQLDMLVPYVATDNYVRHLNWTGAEEFKIARKKAWMVENHLAGYVKTVGNLNLVLVRNAGHFVMFDQPFWTWNLITHFTHNRDF